MKCYLKGSAQVILWFVFFFYVQSTSAQISDSLKRGLRRISDIMYHNGNDQYFIADALADELLQPGTPYRIDYGHGILYLDGKPVPEEYRKKYLSFYAENYRRVGFRRVSCDGAKLSDLFDSGQLAKKGGFSAEMVFITGQGNLTGKQQSKIYKHLESMVVEDRLIDTNLYYDVRILPRVLYINGGAVNGELPVDEKIYAKYTAALKMDGFDIYNANASLMYNNNYRKADW